MQTCIIFEWNTRFSFLFTIITHLLKENLIKMKNVERPAPLYISKTKLFSWKESQKYRRLERCYASQRLKIPHKGHEWLTPWLAETSNTWFVSCRVLKPKGQPTFLAISTIWWSHTSSFNEPLFLLVNPLNNNSSIFSQQIFKKLKLFSIEDPPKYNRSLPQWWIPLQWAWNESSLNLFSCYLIYVKKKRLWHLFCI